MVSGRNTEVATCYITSRELLDDYTIVESDPDNEGMIRKQNEIDLICENYKDIKNKRLGYIIPDKLNRTKVSFDNVYLYKIELKS